jgi:prepilin-type N-terminal cleavage/methylation domain-containing protein
MVMFRSKRTKGFTIVELLIVIVIIGILAAIVVVSYTGVQQRANNTATAAALDQAIGSILLYHSNTGVWPNADGLNYCLTTDSLCTRFDGTVIANNNANLIASLSTYGGLPNKVKGGTTYYGLSYIYFNAYTLDNVPTPFMIVFWLDGTNQDCQATTSKLISVTDQAPTNNFTAARNAKADTTTGQTRCYMMLKT